MVGAVTSRSKHISADERYVGAKQTISCKDMVLWVTVDGELWHFSWNAYQTMTDDDMDQLKVMLNDACDREKARRISERH